MRKLQESDDMAATLQEMRDNQEITEEDYQKGLLLVEEKKKEDVVRPISSTAAGVASGAIVSSVNSNTDHLDLIELFNSIATFFIGIFKFIYTF